MALTTTWYTYPFHIVSAESIAWPIIDRPITYDPDLFWSGTTYNAIEVSGGGRYKNNVVVIGENDVGQGLIYYG
jgi:hypothetical protein